MCVKCARCTLNIEYLTKQQKQQLYSILKRNFTNDWRLPTTPQNEWLKTVSIIIQVECWDDNRSTHSILHWIRIRIEILIIIIMVRFVRTISNAHWLHCYYFSKWICCFRHSPNHHHRLIHLYFRHWMDFDCRGIHINNRVIGASFKNIIV